MKRVGSMDFWTAEFNPSKKLVLESFRAIVTLV
jgi:hypothetical protein